uniref:Uncharacterized protein n=1 Tax=Leersia perrieri TaxID=77586 RepID=A0A0D9WF47_9ORYZ
MEDKDDRAPAEITCDPESHLKDALLKMFAASFEHQEGEGAEGNVQVETSGTNSKPDKPYENEVFKNCKKLVCMASEACRTQEGYNLALRSMEELSDKLATIDLTRQDSHLPQPNIWDKSGKGITVGKSKTLAEAVVSKDCLKESTRIRFAAFDNNIESARKRNKASKTSSEAL